MKQEEAVRAAAALGEPFGGRFVIYNLREETAEFTEDIPVLMLHPRPAFPLEEQSLQRFCAERRKHRSAYALAQAGCL